MMYDDELIWAPFSQYKKWCAWREAVDRHYAEIGDPGYMPPLLRESE